MVNLLISGTQGSGKDTFADFLPGYIKLAFATPIREIMMLLRSSGVEETYAYLTKLSPGLPSEIKGKLEKWRNYPILDNKQRALTQDIGQGLRQYDDSIWINAMKAKIKPDNKYVISDCRFIPELQGFNHWHKVYIEADRDKRIERIVKRDGRFDYERENNEAEQQIPLLKPMCDIVVENNGSLGELKIKALELITCK